MVQKHITKRAVYFPSLTVRAFEAASNFVCVFAIAPAGSTSINSHRGRILKDERGNARLCRINQSHCGDPRKRLLVILPE
jgi:hypothetical protein